MAVLDSKSATRQLRWRRGMASVAALLAAAVASASDAGSEPSPRAQAGARLEFEFKSEYSHIRVWSEGSVRRLTFVRDSGEESTQTVMDLDKPHELLMQYSKAMFASYLFQPEPKGVLIVGLGGGAMVQFLRHHQPKLQIDAVEIDPVVVRVAADYFDTRPSRNVNIITADVFDYLARTPQRYDVVYMDAFLKPSADTDDVGVPLRLKTVQFLKTIRSRLRDQGLLVVDLNLSDDLVDDIRSIREVFPQDYMFQVPGWGNLVLVASLAEEAQASSALAQKARELDQRFGTADTFQQVVSHVVP